MSFEWLALHNIHSLDLELSLPGYGIVLLYTILVGIALLRHAGDFGRLSARRWGLLGLCLAAAPLLSRALIWHITLRAHPPGAELAMLGLLPLLVAALWLGQGPAILVGLVAGLTLAVSDGGRTTQPLEMALLGLGLGSLLTQTYRGRLADRLRQPLVAALLGAFCIAWPLGLLSSFAIGQATLFANLERTAALLWPLLVTHMFSALVAGMTLQLVLARWPGLHPAHAANLIPAPWERRLSQRTLYTFAPIAILVIVVLVGVVTSTAYRVATQLVIDQMSRDAASASSQMPFFIQMGRSLIRDLANDERITGTAGAARQAHLAEGLRAVPFFQQLLYLDANQTLLAAYPQEETSAPVFSPEENTRIALALQEGVPAEVATYGADGQSASVSFIAPIVSSGEPAGVLVGRTGLDINPILGPVIDVLQGMGNQQKTGFIIDDQNRILLYPARPERQTQVYSTTNMVEIPAMTPGQAFRQYQTDGTRQLVYLVPITGRSDWRVVMIVPNELVLALAVQIALPTLLLTVLLSIVALPVGIGLLREFTNPLEELAQAAGRIAEGELGYPLDMRGEDEIGRLGRAFEQMRYRLAERLNEQERLLSVSRSVSSSLELFRAMPPILNSALDVTQAAGVRVVLRRGPDDPLQVYTAGEAAAVMAVLDRQLLDLVEREGTVVISQLRRASGSLDISGVMGRIQALVGLPLRGETSFHGILWLGYDTEHNFEQSEMNFVSTLAGQAAIAVANARLFAEAEEGRRKLEAVLESTADGMVVVDNEGRVVLINPAAEDYFDIRMEHTIGRRASEVIDVPELATLMTRLQEPLSVLELPHRNGKTLLANTSTILGQDGSISGRVTVLRDITALKELDSIKTVFLRMVSHDLRSPLTYMRGFVSMLSITGPLNERQNEAVAYISAGIEYIAQMTERLTYLSRLQFGDEAELELTLVNVPDLIDKTWLQHEPLARQKNISCHFKFARNLPPLLVDDMLYSHAISNLIQNALKYTPEGGKVQVRVYMQDENWLTVAVDDNGIGIRPEDQRQLFEAFYRVPQREGDAPRPKGSGLGLALVRAVARAHDGSVGVTSIFGKGSSFTLTVPVRHFGDM